MCEPFDLPAREGDPVGHTTLRLNPADRVRISQWYVKFRRPLIRMLAARRVLPLSSIEDLVQQTFLRAWSYSPHEPIENALGYLLTVALHLASEWRERIALRAPHVSDEVLEQAPCGESDDPESTMEKIELTRDVRKALGGLTDRRRHVMILRYLHELTYAEIGERLRISERMVNRDVVKAHRGVRAAIETDSAAGATPINLSSVRRATRV